MASPFKPGKTQRARRVSQRAQRILAAFALILAVFAVKPAFSQTFPLQIQVSVLPPYSAYLQDYPGTGQRVRVFLINTSRNTYQIRLLGQLTGDNGIEIRTSPNYRPPRPLTVPPGQTLLNRADLEGLFDLNQIEVTGIDKNLLARGFPLPDGTYQLCVRAFNETATNTASVAFGQPLSAEFPLGCSAPIVVRAVEPPILIAPLCDGQVTATTPQAVVFTWTPPAGVSPAQVDYTLRVVELPQLDVDPNVFIDVVALPKSGVEVRNLRTSTFLYGPTQPPLTVGKRYAWRVQAVDRSGKLNFLNDGKSPVCSFTYGTGLPVLGQLPGIELAQTPVLPIPGLNQKPAGTPPDSTLAGAVKAPVVMKSKKVCRAIPIGSGPNELNPQSGSLDGKTVKVGEFDLTIYQAKYQNGGYTGTGRVTWNGVPIKVTFQALKVNGQNQVFDGIVGSDSSGPGMPNIPLGEIGGYGGLPNDYFDKITTNLVEAAKQAVAIPLPLKYDGKIGTIGINHMNFSPIGAEMDLVMGVSLPEANLNLFLAAVDVCTSPQKKLPDTGTLYLIKDLPLPIPGSIGQNLVIKKSDPNSPTPDGTYASIVNGDFDKVHGVMELNLGQSVLKLDDKKGNVIGGDVIATITADFDKWADWIGSVKLSPFQLPLLKGVTFSGTDIAYDHSDKVNPVGFNMPTEYTGETGVTWQGIYFNQLTVELPSSLKSNPRIGVMVKGGILDGGSKFTGHITPANKPVLDYANGSLAGFGFSIDDIDWLIVQNSNKGGSFTGKLQFPISDDTFSYSCNLSAGFDKMQFTAIPKDGYRVPLFAANMDLNANTAISVLVQSGQKTQISMALNGHVAIDVKKFAGSGAVGQALDATIPKLTFEQFTLSTTSQSAADKPLGGSGLFLNTGNWALTNDVAKSPENKGGKGPGGPSANPDDYVGFSTLLADDTKSGTLAGFPIDFDPPTVVSSGKGTGIRLGIGIHLGEGADDASFVQAHGSLDILGDVTLDGGHFKPVYKGTYPTSISLTGNIGVLNVKGGLDFFYDNDIYGNGMKGNAKVTIPSIGTGISMVMLFGKKDYHYAFIDANVMFTPGIPMVGPLLLTGFGGGMHYNMTMSGTPASVANSTVPPSADLTKIGVTPSGVVYTPAQGSWGITARVLAGVADAHVFNSSLELTIDFKGSGLNSFAMIGKATVISASGDPSKSDGVVNAQVTIGYTPGSFDLGVDIDATLVDIKVNVPFGMHFASNGDWFVKLGDPYNVDKRVSAKLFDINSSIASAHLDLNGYVAAGNVFTGLPPLPQTVTDFFASANAGATEKQSLANRKQTYPVPNTTGKNFSLLFGGQLAGDFNVQVMPFRCSATAVVGFDAGLFQGLTCGGGGTAAGINGWYGQGQGYAYFKGGVDLYVDVWFFEGSVNIMELTAAALFRGGFMNPTWANGNLKIKGSALDGLISVETRQDFAFGEVCIPVYGGDPVADIEIISEVTPANGSTDVNVRPTVGATFNMPIDKTFSVFIPTGEVRNYVFQLQQPQFLINKKVVAASDLNPLQWAVDKRSFTLSSKVYQPSFANCSFTTMVVIKEVVEGSYYKYLDPYIDKTKQREPRSQSKSVTFTLGKQPTTLPPDALDMTWPVTDQHFFLKNQQNQGFVRSLETATFGGLDILKPGTNVEFLAQFIEPNGTTLTSPMAFDGNRLITFNLPSGLKKEQIYRLELRRRTKKTGSANSNNLTASTLVATNYADVKYQQTSFNANAFAQIAEANAGQVGQELFSLVFRTSKYNTLTDKINGLQLSGDYLNTSPYGANGGLIELTAKGNFEDFDDFELVGGQVYNTWYKPTLWYETPVGNSPYDQTMKTKVYDLMSKWKQDGGEHYTECCQPNPQYGNNYPGDKYDVECWPTLSTPSLLTGDAKRNDQTLLPTTAMFGYRDVANQSTGKKQTTGAAIPRPGFGKSKSPFIGAARPTGVSGQTTPSNDPKFAMSPLPDGSTTVKFAFERDRIMMYDLVAVMYFLKGMAKQANDLLFEQCPDWPKNDCYQYASTEKAKIQSQPPVADPKHDGRNATNRDFTANSPTLELGGRFYLGRYANDQQWKVINDPFYNTNKIDYDDLLHRSKTDGFEVIFHYGFDPEDGFWGGNDRIMLKPAPEFPAVKVSKLFFLGGLPPAAQK